MTAKINKSIFSKTGLEHKQLRKLRGLTQLNLVEAIGSEIKKVSRIECGYQLPDLEYMDRLDAIGANTNVLRKLVNKYEEEKIERRKNVIDQNNEHNQLFIDKDSFKNSIEIRVNEIKITIEYDKGDKNA